MNIFHIKRLLITAIYVCSVFVAFIALLGTLRLRQATLACADDLRSLEMMCERVKSTSFTLAFSSLKGDQVEMSRDTLRYSEQLLQKHMMRVANWEEYKKSFAMRNALALNLDRRH